MQKLNILMNFYTRGINDFTNCTRENKLESVYRIYRKNDTYGEVILPIQMFTVNLEAQINLPYKHYFIEINPVKYAKLYRIGMSLCLYIIEDGCVVGKVY